MTNLVLDEELNTLDGGSGGLGDSGGDTTHWKTVSIVSLNVAGSEARWLHCAVITYSGSRQRSPVCKVSFVLQDFFEKCFAS